MRNGTELNHYDGTCPVHGTDCKKEYNFGMNDATVDVFDGCRCAVTVVTNGWSDAYYYSSYTAAAGKAKMASSQAAVW